MTDEASTTETAEQPSDHPKAPVNKEAIRKAKKIVALKKRGAKLYAEIDSLLAELVMTHAPVAGQRHGPDLKVGRDTTLRLVDPFVDPKTGEASKHWKHTPIGRYDVEVKSA